LGTKRDQQVPDTPTPEVPSPCERGASRPPACQRDAFSLRRLGDRRRIRTDGATTAGVGLPDRSDLDNRTLTTTPQHVYCTIWVIPAEFPQESLPAPLHWLDCQIVAEKEIETSQLPPTFMEPAHGFPPSMAASWSSDSGVRAACSAEDSELKAWNIPGVWLPKVSSSPAIAGTTASVRASARAKLRALFMVVPPKTRGPFPFMTRSAHQGSDLGQTSRRASTGIPHHLLGRLWPYPLATTAKRPPRGQPLDTMQIRLLCCQKQTGQKDRGAPAQTLHGQTLLLREAPGAATLTRRFSYFGVE
jgi:hypothetical protein